MLKLRPTYEQMLKEARTIRLRILPERERRSSSGILIDDVDFDEFDLNNYERRIDINNNNNPDKATQTDSNLASSSHSSVGEDVRTQEEAVKENQEEMSEASSIRSIERNEQAQKTREGKSLMRRMFDSMFEETEVDMVPLRGALGSQTVPSRQVSVATEQSQASSSSLPMNVKKTCEPSPVQSPASSSTNRSVLLPLDASSEASRASSASALLPVAGNTLTPQVSPDVIPSSRPSNRSVENIQSSSAPSERTIEYLQSSEPSDRTIEYIEPSPPVSVVSSRRSQQTIEYPLTKLFWKK